jgi:hypothetical protein
MIKSNFREWTLDLVEEAFAVVQVDNLPILDDLLAFEYQVDSYENRFLTELSNNFRRLGGDDWNEVELENKLISPLIVLSGIDNKQFSYFLERELSAEIGDYDLSGKVDGMIATGFRNPKKPYFCINEYKRGTDPNGDPKGQALIAMMVAQQLNHDKKPIYGCYVIGRSWCFMALIGNEYAISKDFSCVDDEVFDIFRIIKGLRVHIEKMIQ